MSEDPILRRISNAVNDAFGLDRAEAVPAEFIAPRDGKVVMLDGIRVFINDQLVTEPTTYRKGDRIRTETVN